jgi:adenylosuccinate lyase
MASMDHTTYQSPYSWRYASREMRALWSEHARRRLWRRIWIALAAAQAEAGLVTPTQLADLEAHAEDVDLARALEIEAEIGHDVMAEVRTYAEQCPAGGAIIHWGATSEDVTGNADVLRQREAVRLLLAALARVLRALGEQIARHQATACMAYTHLQPAEPTTVGYRLAQYAQDLLEDYRALQALAAGLRGKGLKGAVGTGAAYGALLAGTGMSARDLEARVLARLELPAFVAATQVYPRHQDYALLAALAGLAASLNKFAFDLRVLQSPSFGELAEPFGARQVGSSAMPFKRNPVNAEKICSLARLVAALPGVAWDNAASVLLERTLDDSANRRTTIPEAFLACDEMLCTAERILKGLTVNEDACRRNLALYGPFAATEPLLMALVRAGASRQEMHERLREHAMAAWPAVKAGQPNPLAGALLADEQLARYVPAEAMRPLLDASAYVGDAVERCALIVRQIEETVEA